MPINFSLAIPGDLTGAMETMERAGTCLNSAGVTGMATILEVAGICQVSTGAVIIMVAAGVCQV